MAYIGNRLAAALLHAAPQIYCQLQRSLDGPYSDG